MNAWTTEETITLVRLWSTHSASQIARQLQRPRSAIAGKAKRLRAEGRLPRNVVKHFEINPVTPPRGAAAAATAHGGSSKFVVDAEFHRNRHAHRQPGDAALFHSRTGGWPLSLAARRSERGGGQCSAAVWQCRKGATARITYGSRVTTIKFHAHCQSRDTNQWARYGAGGRAMNRDPKCPAGPTRNSANLSLCGRQILLRNSQKVAPTALGDTQQGKAAAPEWIAATQSRAFWTLRRPKRRQTQKPRRPDLPSPIGIATTRLGVGLSPDHAVTEQFARVVPARADIGGAEP